MQNDDARRALMGSNMQRQAVPLIKPESPIIATGVEKIVARDSGQIILAEEDGVVVSADATHIKVKTKNKEKEYQLKTFLRTNQYTCFHQKPIVKKGGKVQKGDALTDGAAISNGALALGQNVLVAFMNWHGGSFEDAIIISEKLVKDDLYSSIYLEA